MDCLGADLLSALGCVSGEMVAFVGAGGKTTAAWEIFDGLLEKGEQAVFTTTTHVFKPARGEVSLILDPDPVAADVAAVLGRGSQVVVAASMGERGDPLQAARCPYRAEPVKLVGLAPGVVDRLSRELSAVTWLVEADGARGRLLKAPAAHEPATPSEVDRVVLVAAVDAIGRRLDDDTVHRPEIAARLLGVETGTTISPTMMADLIAHPLGGMKDVPSDAESIVLLAEWNDTEASSCDSLVQRLLASPGIARIVLADLRRAEPVRRMWTS